MRNQSSICIAAALTAALALGAPAAAQSSISASESHVLAARAAVTAAGTSASANFVAARETVGLPVHSLHASSANYALDAGLAWIPAQLAPGAPLLAGFSPAGGDSDGGALTKVFGFNLDDPSGLTAVNFAGAPAASVAEQSNTWLRVVTPAGENGFGNPLGPVDVVVQTSLGSAAAADGYVYRPALLQESAACFGCTLSIGLEAAPGAFHMLAIGVSVPGVAIPIPPIEGMLEIWSGLVMLKGLAASASGTAAYQIPVPPLAVPPFPAEFQGVALSLLSPVTGSFTNRLVVTVGP